MFRVLLILFVFVSTNLFAESVVIKNDNGIPRSAAGYSAGWEESVFLVPDGPCDIREIYIYLTGDAPAKDTIYFTGDPGEGLPGSFWVIAYNQISPPVIVDYDGTPGWDTIQVNGLRSEGLDRICVQHKITSNGPTFVMDNNGCSEPLRSYVLDPDSENTYGWPGIAYRASGDYLIRMLVDYDNYDAEENTSMPAPPPTLTLASIEAGIVNANGDPIGGNQITIVDWNNDGFDDVSISSYKFQNNGDGTFKNVTEEMGMTGFSIWTDYDSDGDLDSYVIREGKYFYDTTIVEGQEQIDSIWRQYDTKSYMTFSQNTIFRNDDTVFTRLDPKEVFLIPYPNPFDDFDLHDSLEYLNDSIHNPYICWAPVWTDYNKDGYPDLYLGNRRSVKGYPNEVFNPDQLWRNEGNGTFSRVTDSCNIGEQQKHKMGENRNQNNLYFNGQDASACDYNMDNNIDIHMINYGLERDFLWENQADGNFNDVAGTTGLKGDSPYNPNPDALTHGHACEWADFNNDGYPDVAVGNLAHPDWRGLFSNPSTIYKNNGPPNYNFTIMGPEMGLKFFESDCGILWFDYDLDGWQDIWIGQRYKKSSHIYKNMGAPDFKLKEVTWKLGSLTSDKWSASRIDFDNDGDPDIMIGGLLYRNDIAHLGKWVNFRLGGSPEDNITSDAFGSRVVVYSGDKLFYREIMGVTSGPLHRQNSNEMMFGLGDISAIDSVVVSYINGNKYTHTNIEVNSKYFIPYMEQANRMKLATPSLEFPKNYATNIDDSIGFIWNECGGADSYQIQVSTCREFDEATIDTCFTIDESSSFSSIDIAGFTATQSDFWRVRAIAEGDTSLWSSVWKFTVGYTRPEIPLLSSPADLSENLTAKPSFSWLASEVNTEYPGKLTYQIQISESEDFSSYILDTNNLKTTSIDLEKALKASTIYFWRVRSIHVTQTGDWSDTWSFTTLALPTTIALLEPDDGVNEVITKPRFRWEEAENVYDYHLIVATDEEFNEVYMENIEINSTTYKNIAKKLIDGTQYFWKVRGLNDGGAGEWSDVWSFTTEGTAPSVRDRIKAANVFVTVENIPNPFSGTTTLSYSLNKAAYVSIEITDILGSKVSQLLSEQYENAGKHTLDFDASELAAGIYYCWLRAEGYTEIVKLVKVNY